MFPFISWPANTVCIVLANRVPLCETLLPVGVIDEVGSVVRGFKKGERVIVSCIGRCGTCENCQKQLYSHCRNGGSWVLGYMNGTQAEYVRAPEELEKAYDVFKHAAEEKAMKVIIDM